MEGGGMRGLYTAGVIDVLMEMRFTRTVRWAYRLELFLDAIISLGRSEEFFAITKSTARIKRLASIRNWITTGGCIQPGIRIL